MKKYAPLIIATLVAFASGVGVTRAAQTNYLGTVFMADTTTPANQLKINADGSINVVCQ